MWLSEVLVSVYDHDSEFSEDEERLRKRRTEWRREFKYDTEAVPPNSKGSPEIVLRSDKSHRIAKVSSHFRS